LQQLKFTAPSEGKVCIGINCSALVGEIGRFNYLGWSLQATPLY